MYMVIVLYMKKTYSSIFFIFCILSICEETSVVWVQIDLRSRFWSSIIKMLYNHLMSFYLPIMISMGCVIIGWERVFIVIEQNDSQNKRETVSFLVCSLLVIINTIFLIHILHSFQLYLLIVASFYYARRKTRITWRLWLIQVIEKLQLVVL